MKNKQVGALPLFIVSIFYGITGINDSLSASLIVNTPLMLSIGFLVFICGQAFILAMIFNNALITSEKLKLEIENKNIELEQKVVERTKTLHDTNKQLSTAMSEIKTLSGCLPICSSCKKIRNNDGTWEQVELYVKKNSTADFTHGICPECSDKLYADYFNSSEQEK